MCIILITTPAEGRVPWSISEREEGKTCAKRASTFSNSVLTRLNSPELYTQPNHQQGIGTRKGRIYSFSALTKEKTSE